MITNVILLIKQFIHIKYCEKLQYVYAAFPQRKTAKEAVGNCWRILH